MHLQTILTENTPLSSVCFGRQMDAKCPLDSAVTPGKAVSSAVYHAKGLLAALIIHLEARQIWVSSPCPISSDPHCASFPSLLLSGDGFP
jgi:hypothetical protein